MIVVDILLTCLPSSLYTITVAVTTISIANLCPPQMLVLHALLRGDNSLHRSHFCFVAKTVIVVGCHFYYSTLLQDLRAKGISSPVFSQMYKI